MIINAAPATQGLLMLTHLVAAAIVRPRRRAPARGMTPAVTVGDDRHGA